MDRFSAGLSQIASLLLRLCPECKTHVGISTQDAFGWSADLLMPDLISARVLILLSMSAFVLHHSTSARLQKAPPDRAVWGARNTQRPACTEATIQQAGSCGRLLWPGDDSGLQRYCGRTQEY